MGHMQPEEQNLPRQTKNFSGGRKKTSGQKNPQKGPPTASNLQAKTHPKIRTTVWRQLMDIPEERLTARNATEAVLPRGAGVCKTAPGPDHVQRKNEMPSNGWVP